MLIDQVHTDFKQNMAWVEELGAQDPESTVLVAGDLSHKLPQLEETLGWFCRHFANVFFVPGNHDLWMMGRKNSGGCADSAEKFVAILEMCERIGVYTRPTYVADGLCVVPLFSWHNGNLFPDEVERERSPPEAEFDAGKPWIPQ